MQGFPEIDGAVLRTPSHGASGTSTQLGTAHTQARQSCSQHSSGRLSDVCVVCVCAGVCVCVCVCGMCEWGGGGGGGENGSREVHTALGGWATCVWREGGG